MEFEELCELASAEVAMISKVLPEEIAGMAGNCTVSFENEPDDSEGLEDGTLGLFEGASLIEEPDPEAMPRIRIFVTNLWDYTGGDEQDFLDEVGTTYLHELGHYLGWDEDEIAERGLE